MSRRNKKGNNPFATGGGGGLFEARVQASFVVLMLTGGHVPCKSDWSISGIKLQGSSDGYKTDDIIIFLEKTGRNQRCKLLGQIKYSVNITISSSEFSKVIRDAWNDFNNQEIFKKGNDAIVLITGCLNSVDIRNVPRLLNHARHTNSADEFFRHIEKTNMFSRKVNQKLKVIRHHLKMANNGHDVSKEDIYEFLKSFYLLGYDLGEEEGVVLSLLYSHMSQFEQPFPEQIWPQIVQFVQNENINARTITLDIIPENILEVFKSRKYFQIPDEFEIPPKTEQIEKIEEVEEIEWATLPYASNLARINLIGEWNSNYNTDIEVLKRLLGGSKYNSWLEERRELLNLLDSPLSVKEEHWKLSKRFELMVSLGSYILSEDLESFKSIAISALTEYEPDIISQSEEYAGVFFSDKTMRYSSALRNGIAEGLVILGNSSGIFTQRMYRQARNTVILIIRETLINADWKLWGSLNDLLPVIAEAAPCEFLTIVRKTLQATNCPFKYLITQGGEYHLSGLIRALEGLAWDERYFTRACTLLGDLAVYEPNEQFTNRSINSLTTILLPWYPQTLASAVKRQSIVKVLCERHLNIGWKVIIQLLPDQHRYSWGSRKPLWIKEIPDDSQRKITYGEYWEQINFYANFAIKLANHDIVKLSQLINYLDKLPELSFNSLIKTLSSSVILDQSEDHRQVLWNYLNNFILKHKRFSHTEWAISGEMLAKVVAVTDKLLPLNLKNLHQHLFSDDVYDFYDMDELREARQTAVEEIFLRYGIESIIQFAESVMHPREVGIALGRLENLPADKELPIEQALFPSLLNSENRKYAAFVKGFIEERQRINGWLWCEEIYSPDWTKEQIGDFLACLPFSEESWKLADQWLGRDDGEYWTRTRANPYEAKNDFGYAVDKLIRYKRPYRAIDCLHKVHMTRRRVNTEQCVRALLAVPSTREPAYGMDIHSTVELITYLQSRSSVSEEDILNIELIHLPSLLNRYNKNVIPKRLWNKLATDSEFFCEKIRMIYRPKGGDEDFEDKDISREDASNIFRLLHEWNTPPGIKKNGMLNKRKFKAWLRQVKRNCAESGHTEVALAHIGRVLIYSPCDPDGLWIDRDIAAVLDHDDAEEMREGYRFASIEGVREVDPTGNQEMEEADRYRERVGKIEDAGFLNFADMLRKIVAHYENDAERNIIDYS